MFSSMSRRYCGQTFGDWLSRGDVRADDLQVVEEIVGVRPRDAAAGQINVAFRIGEDRNHRVERLGAQPLQRVANVRGNRVGEQVQRVLVGGVGAAGVAARDRLLDLRGDLLADGALHIRKSVETEFARGADDRRRRDAGLARQFGDRAEPGHRIVLQQTLTSCRSDRVSVSMRSWIRILTDADVSTTWKTLSCAHVTHEM